MVCQLQLIEHEGREFDDSKLRPYQFSKKLADNFYHGEAEIFVVYGMPEGIGKSAYCNHVLSDLLGYQACKNKEIMERMWEKEKPPDAEVWEADWERTKQFVKYPPDDVVDMCMHMVDHELKDITFHWDDAGTWLNAMDFHDPFVIAFMKFLSLLRTIFGGIILSTPVEEWVLKKLRTARGVYHIEVKRMPGTDRRYRWRPRTATCYHARKYKGNPKTYWPVKWEDNFLGIMPDSFYKWYEPQRKHYTKMAVQLMKKALVKRKQRGFIREVASDEEIVAKIEEHLWSANEKSKEFSEVIDQRLP